MERRKFGERPFANRAAVDEQRAWRRFPEPGNQRRQSALAAAGGTDDGQSRAGGNVQVDVVQDGRTAGLPLFVPGAAPRPVG